MCALAEDGAGKTETKKGLPVSAHESRAQATATQLHVFYVEQTKIEGVAAVAKREGRQRPSDDD